VYHVLNRGAARFKIFRSERDYLAFEQVLIEALVRVPTRLLDFVVMPNHWHLLIWPRADGELSRFMNWLTLTHTQRWRHGHHTVGYGGLYQGRFKSFPIERDEHFLTVCRYVERNPLRARLVERADRWRWSGLWHRQHPGEKLGQSMWGDWPVDRPQRWLQWVNRAQTAAEVEAIRASVTRSRPYGSGPWVQRTAVRLGLESSLRRPGRPRKEER
jgi:putative transposase